jgi:MFS family permease
MATQVWLITDATRRVHGQTAKAALVDGNQVVPAGHKPEATRNASPVLAVLLPIVAVVSIGFLVIGLALPVLPLNVHQGLGLGTFVVGLVAGAQFGASLLSRFWAGGYADSRGAKHAIVTGLLLAAAAGLLYLLSLRFVGEPEISVTILLLGRVDLALGLANPALGLVASGAGLGGVYLVSTLVVLCATTIAVRLLNAPPLDLAKSASALNRSQDYEQ